MARSVASRRQIFSGDEAVARVLVTMKQVGLNVVADPLFTAAYTGVRGALSGSLEFPEGAWIEAILGHLAPKLHRLKRESFQIGRNAWQQ